MDEKGFLTPEGQNTAPGQGRRLDPAAKPGKGKLMAALIGVAVALLLAAYLGLCAFASNSGHLPGATVLGVELKGKTPEQLRQALDEATRARFDPMTFTVSVQGSPVTLNARDAQMAVDVDAVLDNASAARPGFLASGWTYLSGLMGGSGDDAPCAWTIGNKNYVNQIAEEAAGLVNQPVRESSWEIEEDEETARLVLTRGVTGQVVDEKDLTARIEQVLLSGEAEDIEATVTVTAPKEPDFDRIAAEVERAPIDASLDMETDEIIPHQLGLSVDAGRIKGVFDALAEGENGVVELDVTQPDVTTLALRATLFRDILGEGSSKVTGTANRVNNVRLAAAACDGVILLPGQQMSYNQTTGQRTTAKGYREATGYTSKGLEDMVGGGVCQPSSTLYQACLHANLEIVNRKNHMYTVSYMPEGVDATVNWPNLDYVFANSTKYPIKVSMVIEKGVLTVRIYGTKTDDNYVKLESVRVSTTPAGVSYQADPEIPRGTTKVAQAAHTGKKVEVYKNTYAADGTLLSRDWVSTDTYRASDKIIAYNPLDGVPGIIAPVTPAEPSVDPSGGVVNQPEEVVNQPQPATPTPSAPEPSGSDPSPTPDLPQTYPSPTPNLPQTYPSPTPEATPTPTPPPVDVALMPAQDSGGIPTE